MSEQATDAALTGADAELFRILDRDEVYVCIRDWSAWGYRTMSADDFVAYTDGAEDPDSGVAEILQWRDAAVEHFRDALVEHIREAGPQVLGRYSDDLVAMFADVVADFQPKD